MQDVAVISKTGELFSAEVTNTVKPRTYTAIELMYFGAVECTSKKLQNQGCNACAPHTGGTKYGGASRQSKSCFLM